MQDLIERARLGDESAIVDFIALMQQKCASLARSFSLSSEIPVDDLLQEVGIRIWRFRHRVFEAEKPVAYSRILARNTMINQYHRTMRQRRIVSALVHERMVAV